MPKSLLLGKQDGMDYTKQDVIVLIKRDTVPGSMYKTEYGSEHGRRQCRVREMFG